MNGWPNLKAVKMKKNRRKRIEVGGAATADPATGILSVELSMNPLIGQIQGTPGFIGDIENTLFFLSNSLHSRNFYETIISDRKLQQTEITAATTACYKGERV